MHYNSVFQLSLLLSSSSLAVALSNAQPYTSGLVSVNPANLLSKRQEGYQPTQRRCGPGDTCAVSCGASYETCPSTDGNLHCYDPTILKQNCCTDGSGNACRENYFCTSDSQQRTWCCPDGLDLVSCAKSYGLTDTLVSEIPAPTAPVTGTGSVPSGSFATGLPTGLPYNNTPPIYPYPNGTYSNQPTDVTGTGSVPSMTATDALPAPTSPGGGEDLNGTVSIAVGTGATNTPSQVTSLPPASFTGSAESLGAQRWGWSTVLGAAVGFAILL